MAPSADDERFMAQAIALSLTHLGQTGTNPSVGCVIVRDGVVIGSAVTAEGGRPHAETQALAKAGDAARGATVYVTLEPCSHHGRTPPCANALVAAGVGRVVVAVRDPDERVSGRGLQILRDAGIAVNIGILEKEARRALAAYLIRQTKRRAQVILKLAVSADGMIGRRGEGQIAITGPLAREKVQQIRAETDAILVGIGTALADDPELTVRMKGLEHRSPVRIVLDRRLELPPTSKLVRTAGQVPVLVVTAPSSAGLISGYGVGGSEAAKQADLQARLRNLRSAGVDVFECGDLQGLLYALASRSISSVLVEGGAATASSFLAAGLVDRILLFTGSGMIGAGGIASPVDLAHIPAGFEHAGTERFGPDRCDHYERLT